MFIKLTSVRVDRYDCEERGGRLTVRKDQIAAIHNSSAYNFDEKTGIRNKNSFWRGGAVVHLTSGKAFHVLEKFTEVEAMLLGEAE